MVNDITCDKSEKQNIQTKLFRPTCSTLPTKKCFVSGQLPEFSFTVQIYLYSFLPLNYKLIYKLLLFQSLAVVSNTNYSDQSVRKMAQTLELPFYGKYLLIAAFLASHNSAKDDKRLFVKHHGKQRKRLQNVNAKTKVKIFKPNKINKILLFF